MAGRDHHPGLEAPDPGDGPGRGHAQGAELLLSGVTCVSDMFCHTSQGSLASLGAVDGLEAMGLRGVVAFGAEDAIDPLPVAAVVAEHHAPLPSAARPAG